MVSAYEYMRGYCVCQGGEVLVAMVDLLGIDATSYPVTVYNVNETAIGTAASKAEYISVWNSDTANQAVGILSGFLGAFVFMLKLKANAVDPEFVIGDTAPAPSGFILTDGDGVALTDSDGIEILYQ